MKQSKETELNFKERDDLGCLSVDRLFTLLSAKTEGAKSLHFMFTYTSTLVIAA